MSPTNDIAVPLTSTFDYTVHRDFPNHNEHADHGLTFTDSRLGGGWLEVDFDGGGKGCDKASARPVFTFTDSTFLVVGRVPGKTDFRRPAMDGTGEKILIFRRNRTLQEQKEILDYRKNHHRTDANPPIHEVDRPLPLSLDRPAACPADRGWLLVASTVGAQLGPLDDDMSASIGSA